MLTFVATLRDKVQGVTYIETVQADSMEDAKDMLASSTVQIVSIREKGAKAQAVKSDYVPTNKLKNQIAWKQAQELLHESKMLGEDVSPKEAFNHFRAKL